MGEIPLIYPTVSPAPPLPSTPPQPAMASMEVHRILDQVQEGIDLAEITFEMWTYRNLQNLTCSRTPNSTLQHLNMWTKNFGKDSETR